MISTHLFQNRTTPMKIILNIAAMAALILPTALATVSCGDKNDSSVEKPAESTKRERNSIKEGNRLYEQKRYAESEIAYKKALEENPDNQTAQFNLASAYLKQRGEDLSNKGDSLIRTADAMLAKVAQSTDKALAEDAFYDRGNVAYKGEDYASAIELYKNALRRNPENEQARQNLRLAQLKKQEQDQNKDRNQDQQQDQQQDQEQQQNQDKQQNQDQNQDQKQDQNKDKQDQQNEQNKQDQQQQQDQKEQKQQQGGLSDASAQQILKAMEDKENGTRQKVELMKQGEEKRANRRSTDKPW